MVEPKRINEEIQPELLKKFTDAPKAIIELAVRILERFGFNSSESVKNQIGIILLLLPIYISGNLFKFSPTTPMIIFGIISVYMILNFFSDNFQKINRIFRGITNADIVIQKIRDGTLADASGEVSLATFDAEGLDKLLIELSKEGLLTYDIQGAIVNTQTIYPKNLRTLFNKDSNVNIHEDFVLKILSFNGIRQKLTDEQIQQIITKYRNNPKIIANLLLNQPQSFKVVETIDNENIKRLYENCQRYSEKHSLLDKYLDIIIVAVKLVLAIVFFILLVLFVRVTAPISVQFPQQFIAISIFFVFFITITPIRIYVSVRRRLRRYIFNKKVNNVLNMDFTQQHKSNKNIISLPQLE